MKRIILIVGVSLALAGIVFATYRAAAPSTPPLSKYMPAGPLLYLEAKDFSSLLKRLEFLSAETSVDREQQLRRLLPLASLPAIERCE